MKYAQIISLFALVCFAFTSFSPTSARAQELPQPSPAAMVQQTVGVTTIKVEYSSPGVKGRVILGKLLPFGDYWRSGANRPTKISFDHDLTFAGTKVPAGEYRFGTIPTKSGWVVALSNDPEASPMALNDETLVLKTKVKSKATKSRERLTYLFENTTENTTDLVLEWSTFKVVVPIKVDTETLVTKAIESTVKDSAVSLIRVGQYLKDHGQPDQAIEHLQASLAIQETWWANWYLAEAMAAKGEKKSAVEHAELAKKLGAGDGTFEKFFKADVDQALVAWAK